MKPKKHIGMLLFGFVFLIIIMVLMTAVSGLVNDQTEKLFEETENSFSKWINAEQANADLIAIHRAMKDVALSKDEMQLGAALSDVEKYDALIKEHFNNLKNLEADQRQIDDVISAYNDWAPIRAKTIEFAKNAQYEEAAENTRTIGAMQVALISEKMQLLVNHARNATETAYEISQDMENSSSTKLLLLAIIEILMSIGIAIVITRKIFKYEFLLHEEKEELRITFDSIGDGIITTDQYAKVLMLNKTAEKLTGWRTEDACGRRFSEVFSITNAITGEIAKDPVAEVLTKDRICELENHTILTARDGTTRHIADSAAPIKDRNRKTTGVVMVFRDVTERRKFQEQIKQSEEHYRMLFDSMLNGYALHEMIFDENGAPIDYRYIDVNPAFERMTGLKKSDCIGKTVKELMPATEQYWIDTYGKVVLTGESVRYENHSEALKKDFEVYAFRPIEGNFSVLIKDITKRKRLEKEIYEEKEQLRITVDSIGDGVITTDINGIVQGLNKVAEELTGWRSEDAIGKESTEVFNISNETTGEMVKDPVKEVLAKDEICEIEGNTSLISKDGMIRQIADSAAPIKDQNGKTTGVVMVFRDVTEKNAYLENIRYMVYHDGLTGLYNRAYFENEIKRMDKEEFFPISIIMADVNGLKLLNDVYGHEAGDNLLKTIAKIFRQSCGQNDIIARLGGDEFAIILPKTSSDRANAVYNKIKQACDKSDLKPIILSVSLGVATKNDAKAKINAVLKDAEDKMYTHKLLEGKSFRGTIIASLQNTLFEKSHAVKDHAIRMIEIANKFGEAIRLSKHEMDEIKLLTLLHDVGKIGIPDSILNKPGELTHDEWNEMKRHPEIGFRIAQSTAELAHISELILTHHEWWDGGGYPQGIKGEQIPKLSRILAIIDTYDVITQARPYKEPLSKNEALDEIARFAGTQFDPELVDEFVAMMK